MNQSYYLSQRGKLLKQFDQASRWIAPSLVKQYSQEFADIALQEARREFEALLPLIPYIGGAKNRWMSGSELNSPKGSF